MRFPIFTVAALSLAQAASGIPAINEKTPLLDVAPRTEYVSMQIVCHLLPCDVPMSGLRCAVANILRSPATN